jgi:hypothetical protein
MMWAILGLVVTDLDGRLGQRGFGAHKAGESQSDCRNHAGANTFHTEMHVFPPCCPGADNWNLATMNATSRKINFQCPYRANFHADATKLR